ncbi:MAG: aminotransferase class V-fold PLP-dependent enzyme, partial [Oscillospiraceae bacterium]|nr:aminotransferase class V-fold PLP-dependent enzyme [Oscillospiraceae bacterium]
MTTPVCDFVRSYAAKKPLRLHMPGHKGVSLLGFEDMDITEIDGADSLYEADGVIAESEANASALFGCDTFYSTEGSSQCIRAMLFLACIGAENAEKPLILAGRNAHKTFLSAAALLDFDTQWLYGENSGSYLSCDISAEYLENAITLAERKPAAVYITSPDYLGNVADVKSLAEVCHRYGVLLLVDNAHGAYLKFLPQSQHPVDLGADMCCDSAHKTLPVLTGGAYLHTAPTVKEKLSPLAKNALAMFGSTSPSYIIMQSLDMANKYIADGYSHKLAQCCERVSGVKKLLEDNGFELSGDETIKITIAAKSYGYTGKELADILAEKNIFCEFSDPDFIVFMFTPEISAQQLRYFAETVCSIPRKEAVKCEPPRFIRPKTAMSVRKAAFSQSEEISVKDAVGRVLAAATVGCPPAV